MTDHRESFDETTRRINNELVTAVTNMNHIEREIEDMRGILIVIEENFQIPQHVGTTEEELVKSESVVLPTYQNLLTMLETLKNLNYTLSSSRTNMVNFWKDLSSLEQEQITEELKLRYEIKKKQYKMEAATIGEMSSAEGNEATIESLERYLQQTQVNQQAIHNVFENYKEVQKKIETINDSRNTILRGVMRMMPAFERYLVTISGHRNKLHGQAKGEKREADETSEESMETEEYPKKKKKLEY